MQVRDLIKELQAVKDQDKVVLINNCDHYVEQVSYIRENDDEEGDVCCGGMSEIVYPDDLGEYRYKHRNRVPYVCIYI